MFLQASKYKCNDKSIHLLSFIHESKQLNALNESEWDMKSPIKSNVNDVILYRSVLPPFSWSAGRNWAGNWWLILTPSQLLTVSRSARCCGPLGTACMALPKMWLLQIPTVQYSNRVTEWNIHKLTLYFNVFPMEKECKKGYQGYACLKPFNSSPFDHDSVV